MKKKIYIYPTYLPTYLPDNPNFHASQDYFLPTYLPTYLPNGHIFLLAVE
jgi:hypothetical protein